MRRTVLLIFQVAHRSKKQRAIELPLMAAQALPTNPGWLIIIFPVAPQELGRLKIGKKISNISPKCVILFRMKKIIIGNWKMNPLTAKEAEKLFSAVAKNLGGIKKTDVVICPPVLYIDRLKKL